MARQSDTELVKDNNANRFSAAAGGRGWLYGAAAVIILLLVFLAGAAVAGRNSRVLGFYGLGSAKGIGHHMHRYGKGIASNGQNRVSGVVTTVSASGFTVAGHGSTTNVTTNGSTQYRGGNQVKQNDSVRVSGTMSNGSLQASQVTVNP